MHIHNSFNNCHYNIFINKTGHTLKISTFIALIIKKIKFILTTKCYSRVCKELSIYCCLSHCRCFTTRNYLSEVLFI